jgi:hypothetical protein
MYHGEMLLLVRKRIAFRWEGSGRTSAGRHVRLTTCMDPCARAKTARLASVRIFVQIETRIPL